MLFRSVLIATVVGFLVVGSCAAIEAGVVATFGEGGAESGVVLAIWAVASLVGGLLFGTLLTLFVVPTAYTLLARTHRPHPEEIAAAPQPAE